MTAQQIVDANKATITNTRNSYTSLSIKKALASGAAAMGDVFTFDVYLAFPAADTPADGAAVTYSGVTFSKVVDSTDPSHTGQYHGVVTLTAGNTLKINRLPVGTTYQVVEQQAKGYAAPAYDAAATGTLKRGGVETTVTNTPVTGADVKYGAATLLKTDAAGTPIAGATYTIYSDSACTIPVASRAVSTDGWKISAQDLTSALPGPDNPDAVLYVKESKAPTGYLLSDAIGVLRIARTTSTGWNADHSAYMTTTSYDVTIARGMTATYSDRPITVRIAKTDAADAGHTPLAGAKLEIYDVDNHVVDSWTTAADAVHEVSGLVAGKTYRLHEAKAPSGYMTSDDISFSVDEKGEVTTDGVVATVLGDEALLMQDSTPMITVDKTNSVGRGIAGARVQILDGSAPVAEWTTGVKPYQIKGLAADHTYTFHEVTPPYGYAAAKDFNFTVDGDGNVVLSQDAKGRTDVATKRNALTVHDDYLVRLRKVSRTALDGDQLGDCTLAVLDSAGTTVDTWTTTDGNQYHEVALPVGSYVLRELKAPDGYDLTADVPFEVTEDGAIVMATYNEDGTVGSDKQTVGYATEKDAPVVEIADWHYNEVKVSKTDIGGTPIKDAELTITGTDVDGNKIMWSKDGTVGRDEKSSSYTWHSKTEGPETLTLVPGTYTIKEVAAPEGYVVVSDFSFTVDKDGKVTLANGTSSGEVELLEDGTIRIKDAKAPAKPQQPDQKAKPATPQQPDQKAKPTMPAALAQTGDLFMNVAPFAMGAATSLGAGLGLRKRRRKHRGKHMR